jgi:hypothetical protein
VTDYSDSPRPADNPADAGTSPGAARGTDAGALAVEDRLPARQHPDPPTGGDDLDDYDYDEAGLAAVYEGDLAALTVEDRLPPRQDASAVEGDDPQDDEAGLTAGYRTDAGALAVEDRLPARQQPDAVGSDDPADDYGEADLGDGYDGDIDALTADDQAPDTDNDHAPDGTTGDQDQPAGEAPSAAGKPGDLAAEAAGASAAATPDQEGGNVTGPESSPAEAPAETGSPAEADAGIRPGEAAQPADGTADPETELKELKAEYEASLKDLKYELQALKDLWQPVSDAPRGTGREADQPYKSARPVDQKSQKEAEHQDDRPGIWSNAKYALYGAVGTTVGMALLDQFAPGVSRVVDDIIVGVPTVIGALVPTLREGWKRKHDDSPDKR